MPRKPKNPKAKANIVTIHCGKEILDIVLYAAELEGVAVSVWGYNILVNHLIKQGLLDPNAEFLRDARPDKDTKKPRFKPNIWKVHYSFARGLNSQSLELLSDTTKIDLERIKSLANIDEPEPPTDEEVKLIAEAIGLEVPFVAASVLIQENLEEEFGDDE